MKRPPRLTIIGLNYAPEPTGNAPYTTSLARGLVRRGWSVKVITSHPHYPAWRISEGYGEWSRSEVIDGVVVTRLRHYVPSRPSSIRRIVSEISFGLRAITASWGRPDVVLLVSPGLLSSATVMTRLTMSHAASAIWIQDLYSLGVAETGVGGPLLQAAMKAIEGWVARRAGGVAAIHRRFASYLMESLRVPESRIETIRNWTHLENRPDGDKSTQRRSMGFADDETIVLHSGNMGQKQGLDSVVAAARYVEEQHLPVRFVLLGGGNQRDHLRSLAAGCGKLDFVDPLPDDAFWDALQAADILLVNELPGLVEMAVPSKLTSYFAAGRPIIAATDTRSVTADEIRASGGGVIVPPAVPHALVQEVLRLVADEEGAALMGARGRLYREKVLDENQAVDRYAFWLERLAAKRGRR